MTAELAWLLPAFLLVAFCYATAGFGGGSSYLAILALAMLPTGELRTTALLCNLVVAGGGTWRLARAGQLPWRRAVPLVVASIPLAYLGGRLALPREQFLYLLGAVLLVAGLLMLLGRWRRDTVEESTRESENWWSSLALGGGLGFLSGVVSIGGGIFLSPVLFLSRWAAAKQIAAVTSLFIFVNSLGGLGGNLAAGRAVDWALTGPLLLAVLIGGQLGSRLTVGQLRAAQVRRAAAVLILVVAVRLLLPYVWPS